MPRINAEKRASILRDYIAGKLTIVAICRKHGVTDDQPRIIAKAAGVWRSWHRTTTRAKCGERKKAVVGLKHRPPKTNLEEWAAACAKRAHYLATVGPYPERVLHPERYGNPPASDDGLTAAARGVWKLREQRREARASSATFARSPTAGAAFGHEPSRSCRAARCSALVARRILTRLRDVRQPQSA